MATKQSTVLKQHRSSLFLLTVCVVALGLMFLLTIAKNLRNRQVLEAHLTDQTQHLETQELLAPLLAELQGEGKTYDPAAGEGDEAYQPHTDVSADNYEAVIGEIARQCGLEQTSLTPDIESILTDTGTLRVNLEVRGAFPDFRHLILALARLPFLSGIEDFRIEGTADAGNLDMFLQLRLQLAASAEGGHDQ